MTSEQIATPTDRLELAYQMWLHYPSTVESIQEATQCDMAALLVFVAKSHTEGYKALMKASMLQQAPRLEGLLSVYSGMVQRCTNPNHPAYKDYGGRGIKVCDEWLNNSQAYLKHVKTLKNYGKGYSLDRIDNDGDYTPGNVRYATRTEQSYNRRNNVVGRTINGCTVIDNTEKTRMKVFRCYCGNTFAARYGSFIKRELENQNCGKCK